MASRLGPAARDRMRRRRRLGDPFTIPARKLFPHVLDNFPTPRLAFKRFGHGLTKLAQVGAAAFAAGTRRWIDDALAWQIVGQRPARWLDPSPFALCSLLLGSRDLSLGFFLGLGLLEIGDGKLDLLDDLLAALRRLPELFLARILASMSFSRSISSARTFTSLASRFAWACASTSISRWARIIACAAARSVGSESEGIVTIGA
jgi:hypothetical protein